MCCVYVVVVVAVVMHWCSRIALVLAHCVGGCGRGNARACTRVSRMCVYDVHVHHVRVCWEGERGWVGDGERLSGALLTLAPRGAVLLNGLRH